MKKLNSKGFTLIELLAVITILGILMLVAIPAISRTIENSRRSTFADTTLLYIDAVRTAVTADEVKCGGTDVSSITADTWYYVEIDGPGDWLQSGGKSPWNKDMTGFVGIKRSYNATTNTTKYTFGAQLVDSAGHGMTDFKNEEDIVKSAIATSGATKSTSITATCVLSV